MRDKERYYMTIEESILQEDIIDFNVYMPKCVNQKLILLQGELEESTLITVTIKTPVSEMNKCI
jgi:hypothetical protein